MKDGYMLKKFGAYISYMRDEILPSCTQPSCHEQQTLQLSAEPLHGRRIRPADFAGRNTGQAQTPRAGTDHIEAGAGLN